MGYTPFEVLGKHPFFPYISHRASILIFIFDRINRIFRIFIFSSLSR